MKTFRQIMLFFDRTTLAIAVFIAAAIIFIITMSVLSTKTGGENSALKTQLTGIKSLAEGALELKGVVEAKEKKTGLNKGAAVVPTLEQILKSLGMKATVIRPSAKNKVKEFTEEDAELEIQNIDLNSIVNLLFKIDNSPVPMKIKNTSIKTTFENPDKFILKLTVSLISKG